MVETYTHERRQLVTRQERGDANPQVAAIAHILSSFTEALG